MALVTHTTLQPAAAPMTPEQPLIPNSDAALLLMGALAGATLTKEARKQYRTLSRKLAWKALGQKAKGLFSKKQGLQSGDTIAGMEPWLFILIVVAAAALGVALFGLWGFIVILLLGSIVYLLLRQSQ